MEKLINRIDDHLDFFELLCKYINSYETIKEVYMEAVLFDLDGTLIDTSEGILDSFFYVINKLNYPQVPRSDVKAMIGMPVQKWFEKIYGVGFEEAQYATELLREHNLKYTITRASIYPDVYKTLEKLKKRNIKVAVATYKREDCALSVLKHFDLLKYCDIVHGADNCNKLKKTDVINMCLKELNLDCKKILFVGDTIHDAQGAFYMGISFIGVTYGFGFKDSEEIKIYPICGLVDNIKDIMLFI